MPQLNGVVTANSDVIVYGGVSYRRLTASSDALYGDIILSNTDGCGDVEEGAYYEINLTDSGIIGFRDDDGDDRAFDDDEGPFSYSASPRDFTVFRREVVTLTTAQLIEQKRIELAELEARLAEESTLKVGNYARFLSGNEYAVGTIVKVTGVDDHASYPYDVQSVFAPDDENCVGPRQLERLTPAEARAALIAQVDALFGREGRD